ncbi:cysteine desulfurase [Ruminococcus sp. OA3]|uniref:cysteine desulfurase family protein n=1 Tax=Ruminococcus sp. OA3 TaxID=2914164 RepID=UPI001F05CFDA|nr:cysteine desulfurase family protein [Ruminococcus sp. OA3]MCH1982763.1 cysteine desulfurase [Ruminococcus sp. OA3]
MEAYLDNSATTRCYWEVCEMVSRTMYEDFGNPSSMHLKGVEAERYVKEAASRIAVTLKASEKEIYFTSGGTESDNWALIGTAEAHKRRGRHIITTDIEHPAVSAPASFLKEQGFEVTRLPADSQGCISLDDLRETVREDTILVSTMYVNNEIGSVQPVEAIGAFLKAQHPEVVYHVDAIQAYGKYRIYPERMGIDLLSVSGHKIHGPKGVGFLYVRNNVKLLPVIHGGGQQNGMRSGTDNVPGIAGLGCAAEICCNGLEKNVEYMYGLKQQLAGGLNSMEDVVIHGMETSDGAPHIVNASFLGVRSEVLLHSLEEKGIFVSAGSACSTHRKSKSPTLSAIGADAKEMESAVRFSFSEETTPEEITYTLEVLEGLLPMLRRYMRR